MPLPTAASILSQAEYDTGHAGIEVVHHLPSIKSLANAFRSLEALEREADFLHSRAKFSINSLLTTEAPGKQSHSSRAR